MKEVPNSDEMDKVLECLLNEGRKMTVSELIGATGLSFDQVDAALHRLSLRGMVRLDSFAQKKRDGQSRWGAPALEIALWEAVPDDESERS